MLTQLCQVEGKKETHPADLQVALQSVGLIELDWKTVEASVLGDDESE